MLKDLFKKEKTKKDEKISLPLMDGYVDVKAYKHDDKGNKKLIYHNTGDNTVTNWMRHVIMLLLSGYSESLSGTQLTAADNTLRVSDQYSKPQPSAHSANTNCDGYYMNGDQYLSEEYEDNGSYPVLPNTDIYGNGVNVYALYPTKILLGTGCEYTDWETLRDYNETDNATWYSNIVQQYGNGDVDTAETNFDKLINGEEESFNCNKYSGTIGLQGVYTGNGSMVPAVTVNDPDTTSNVSSSADMAKRYGVVGAIKSLYLPVNGTDNLDCQEATISDSGRLLKGEFRGAGRPCFIYFRRNNTADSGADWDKQTSDVFVSKDSENTFLNRITFRVVIPAQSSGTAAVGVYNPFNGYTFKQVGLYNDAVFSTKSSSTPSGSSTIINNMPCGMLLAIKNLQSFTKTADESIEFTWTLTI